MDQNNQGFFPGRAPQARQGSPFGGVQLGQAQPNNVAPGQQPQMSPFMAAFLRQQQAAQMAQGMPLAAGLGQVPMMPGQPGQPGAPQAPAPQIGQPTMADLLQSGSFR